MQHVFISYVREDTEPVDRLAASFRRAGIQVWLDRTSIEPGERWRPTIRKAIQEGAFFLACFSGHYAARGRTFMNEELTIAIDELRLRPNDRAWFIPVILPGGSVPDRAVGGGETLADIQFVDLRSNWRVGVHKLVETVTGAAARASIADFVRDVSRQPYVVGLQRAGAQLARSTEPTPTIFEVASNSAYRVEVTAVEPSRDDNEEDFAPHPGALLAERLSALGFKVSLGHWDSARLLSRLRPERKHTLYVVHKNNKALAQQLAQIARDMRFAPRVVVLNTQDVARLSTRLAATHILEYSDAMCAFRGATA